MIEAVYRFDLIAVTGLRALWSHEACYNDETSMTVTYSSALLLVLQSHLVMKVARRF